MSGVERCNVILKRAEVVAMVASAEKRKVHEETQALLMEALRKAAEAKEEFQFCYEEAFWGAVANDLDREGLTSNESV